jgi:hypothetical protein
LRNYTQYRGNGEITNLFHATSSRSNNTGAGEELLLRSAAAPEVRLCAKYSSLVHFNLNQNIQQNIVSQKRV